jgi:hypothetical protein
VTLQSKDASVPGGEAADTIDHVEPFHESMRAFGCEFPPSEGITPPTAQQLHALVHVVAMKRLDCEGSVLGLVTMFQPEGVALTAGLTGAIVASATRTAPVPTHPRTRRLVENVISHNRQFPDNL